jgi:hypothetical protein
MSSLFILLTRTLQAMAPSPPGLELVGLRTILAHSLAGALTEARIAEIEVAMNQCAAGDIAGLARAVDVVAHVGRNDPEQKIARVADGLADLLALRTMMEGGIAQRAQLRLARPASFALLRSLYLPTPIDQPGTALIGLLDDGYLLRAPQPVGKHLLLRHIDAIEYDGAGAGPLLSMSIPSNGPNVPREAARRGWRQIPAAQAFLQALQGERKIIFTTRQIAGPVLIGGPDLQIEIAPEEAISLYETALHDDRQRRLFTYIRAYPRSEQE